MSDFPEALYYLRKGAMTEERVLWNGGVKHGCVIGGGKLSSPEEIENLPKFAKDLETVLGRISEDIQRLAFSLNVCIDLMADQLAKQEARIEELEEKP